ncbi:hypothetical protein QMK61_04565 [Fulvimonas sp. R45]|nr:hypothetical protein [Fulvimonas sp. R45]MDO1528100.1 hypothetical protein [Fulvimonas sp. R45]
MSDDMLSFLLLLVIPAQAGIQRRQFRVVAKTYRSCYWIPACAGMT